MAGPSSTGNYAIAGEAVARENEKLFKVTRENSPDMASLVQNAAKRNAEKEIAAMRAKNKVLKTGVAEFAKTTNYKEGSEAEQNLKSAKRKAGLLATAGGFVGKGIAGFGPSEYELRTVGDSDQYYDTRITAAQQQVDEATKALTDFQATNGIPELPKPEDPKEEKK